MTETKSASMSGTIWISAWLLAGIAAAIAAMQIGPSGLWPQHDKAIRDVYLFLGLPALALIAVVPATVGAVRMAGRGNTNPALGKSYLAVFVARIALAIVFGVALAFVAREFVPVRSGSNWNEISFGATWVLTLGVPIAGALVIAFRRRARRHHD